MFLNLQTGFVRVIKVIYVVSIILTISYPSLAQHNDGLSCVHEINLSLDTNSCTDTLRADRILEDDSFQPALYDYSLKITDEHGKEVDSIFGLEDLWKRFTVSVTGSGLTAATGSGTISCWGFVNVEFYGDLVIQCPTGGFDVNCLLDPAVYPEPIVPAQPCGIEVDLVQTSQDIFTETCDGTDVVGVITREYTAVNEFGFTGPPCIVTYNLKEFNLADIHVPDIGDGVFACDEDNILSNPSMSGIPFILSSTGSGIISTTGSGTAAGQPADYFTDLGFDVTFIYPTPPTVCNLLVSLEEDTLRQDDCETQVYREFTVQQWLCDGSEKTERFPQIITLRDLDGPQFSCPSTMDTINIPANSTNCEAFVNLPFLEVTDDCSGVTEVRMEHPRGIEYSNGGTVQLPMGEQVVTYVAINGCETESRCVINVNVEGTGAPVIICDEHVSISLTNNGIAHVPATAFDDGSYGCGGVTILAAKMLPDACDTSLDSTEFKDHVKFCCVEASTRPMVRVRAYNHFGVYNECMVEVIINDKNPVALICPSNIEVSCDFVYDVDNLSVFGSIATSSTDRESITISAESVNFPDGIGRDGLVNGGCDTTLDEEIDIDENITCGTGTIRRTFSISNENDTRTCIQTIEFTGGEDFDEMSIVWPKDTTLTLGCEMAVTTPEALGSVPIFTGVDCQQLGASFVDQLFTTSDIDNTCRKIFRSWTIIDWCDEMPILNATGDTIGYTPRKYPSSGDNTMLQVIRIESNEKPVVICVGETEFEGVDPSCLVSGVDLSAEVEGCDNVVEYNFEYLLDLDRDGVIDSVGNTLSFNGQLPSGEHVITWTATDPCGNTSVPCQHFFEVKNIKGPTAVCIAQLVISLEQMDTDFDGQPDTVMQVLWAKDIDSGSSQACGNDLQYSFRPDTITLDTSFNCESLLTNNNKVALYVHDDTGNVGECWTEVEVQDPFNRCGSTLSPNNDNLATISGLLTTESGDRIANADISLLGSELSDLTTDINGQYAFSNMPMGGNYTVVAEKDKDHINGVSTLDLVLIQKHVLGVEILDSPYKMIAADINRSNGISAADIVELRKLILGEQAEFSNNTSWRFVDQDYSFPEVSNPWSENFPEEYDITGLDHNMSIDFLGIKVGDVSGNASASNFNDAELRSTSQPLRLTYSKVTTDNNVLRFEISSSNFIDVNGFQTTFSYDASTMEFVSITSENLNVSESNIGTAAEIRGLITMSWSDANAVSLNENEEVFTLLFRNKTEGTHTIKVSSELLQTEAYFNGNISDQVTLNASESASLFLNQNTPNPWKEQTTIKFELQDPATVNIRIVDMAGRSIMIDKQNYQSGLNSLTIDRSDVPQAGVYIIEFRHKNESHIKRMIVID